MTWNNADGARKLRSRRWWIVAATLLLLGIGCVVVGLQGHHYPLAGPAVAQSAGSSPHRGTTLSPPDTVPAPVVRSVPVSLRIPAIGVSVPLISLGLNLDGTVQVPTDYQQAGWFQLGPTPGQVGSAVILGHVDSRTGPAVFFQIRSLTPGNEVDVSLADGMTAHFAVTSVQMYSKQQFPAQRVYGSSGFSTLQLVTCGGAFDTRTG